VDLKAPGFECLRCGFVQSFEDEGPETGSWTKITYIFCYMGGVVMIWLDYLRAVELEYEPITRGQSLLEMRDLLQLVLHYTHV